jgi:hypothetical protein
MRGILAAADFTLFLRAFDDLVKGSHVAGMHVSVE